MDVRPALVHHPEQVEQDDDGDGDADKPKKKGAHGVLPVDRSENVLRLRRFQAAPPLPVPHIDGKVGAVPP